MAEHGVQAAQIVAHDRAKSDDVRPGADLLAATERFACGCWTVAKRHAQPAEAAAYEIGVTCSLRRGSRAVEGFSGRGDVSGPFSVDCDRQPGPCQARCMVELFELRGCLLRLADVILERALPRRQHKFEVAFDQRRLPGEALVGGNLRGGESVFERGVRASEVA